MMSRPTPRHLPVPPGQTGVATVARAMRHLLDGDAQPVAIAPAVNADGPDRQHAAAMAAALREDAPIDHPDAALVIATSGSTGEPHGVLLSLPALVAAADRGASVLGTPGLWLAAVPVTGIGGILSVVRSLRAGVDPVALPSVGGAGPFTPDEFATSAESSLARAAALGLPCYVSLVPTQLRRLVNDGGRGLDLLARFRGVVVGGASVPAADKQAAAAHGVHLVESYGATETCGGVVYNGYPVPGVGLSFRDLETGAATVDGPGRIVIDGPTLALGYRLRRDLTAAAFRSDGFHSPDFGRRVPGSIEVSSRLDQIVKVGGVKVSLSAVSNALRSHPRVIDAVTVADADPEWGSVPVAYVVTDDTAVNAAPLQAELLAAVAERLGRASQPRRIELVANLPTSHSGKSSPPAAH